MTFITPKRFQQIVLKWFDGHGRKHFPWQKNKTPYRVWVSEIMLQQTQVTTVIPYFQRFILHFPDTATLAQATEDEVLHLWSGLGYYSRARYLHRTARIIQDTYNGNFPADAEQLQQLPGIGRSTAGAILSCAFNKKAAILDGNVKRLLTRFYAFTQAPNTKKLQNDLWEIAERYTPDHRVADYTQVMMDLGATICTRKNPQCSACPLQLHCLAYKQGIVEQLPIKKTRVRLPVRTATFLILRNKDSVLLQKRASSGIWGGLWSLPEIAEKPSIQQIKNFCFNMFHVHVKQIESLDAFRHTFSHFHLDIFPIYLQPEEVLGKVMDNNNQIWYSIRHAKKIGLPAPVQSLLSKLI